MSDKIKVLSLVGLGGVAVICLAFIHFSTPPEINEELRSVIKHKDSTVKVEPVQVPSATTNPGLSIKSDTPEVKSEPGVKIDTDTVTITKPESKEKEPTSLVIPSEAQNKDLGSYWLDIINDKSTTNTRVAAATEFKKQFDKQVVTGNIPFFVNNYPLSYSSKSDSGFSRSIFSFSNGTLELLTLLLPDVVADSSRLTIYSILNIGGEVTTTTLDNLGFIPTAKALTNSNGTNYILLSGAKLDQLTFKQGGTVRLATLRVDSKGVVLIPFDSSTELLNSVEIIDNNILSLVPKVPGYSVDSYTDTPIEGTVPNRIHLEVRENEKSVKLFDFVVKDGKSSLVERKSES